MSTTRIHNTPPDKLYKSIEIEEIIKFNHDAVQWRFWFDAFRNGSDDVAKDPKALKALRRLILHQTMEACRSKSYHVVDLNDNQIKNVDIDEKQLINAAVGTRVYVEKEFPQLHTRNKSFTTKVTLFNGDCINAGLWLKKQIQNSEHNKVAVLNMASAHSPGGGYKNGAGAQEENLHRRTNLYQCLENVDHLDENRQWSYPIPEFGGIFTTDAVVIRGSEDKGYPWLQNPENLSFISVAAYRNPKWDPKIETGMMRKMKIMLNMCLENHHYNVVLSAFGCGAYRNPPKNVARCFKKVVTEFNGLFDNIIFAIIDDHNSFQKHNAEGNLTPFAEAFDVQVENLVWDE
jgi:uncharacterized protein (TIGR02452 family)